MNGYKGDFYGKTNEGQWKFLGNFICRSEFCDLTTLATRGQYAEVSIRGVVGSALFDKEMSLKEVNKLCR